MAVFVQNSSVVGPNRTTERNATRTPKTRRPAWPSGTVLGSGTMKNAKINTSGEVTRICQSCWPHIGVAYQLAIMQWSGTGIRASATNNAKAAMYPSSSPRSFSSHPMKSPPPIRIA